MLFVPPTICSSTFACYVLNKPFKTKGMATTDHSPYCTGKEPRLASNLRFPPDTEIVAGLILFVGKECPEQVSERHRQVRSCQGLEYRKETRMTWLGFCGDDEMFTYKMLKSEPKTLHMLCKDSTTSSSPGLAF